MKVRDKVTSKLIQEVAQEMKIPARMVGEVLYSSGKYAAGVIGNFENMRIADVGLFRVKPKLLMMIDFYRALSPDQRKFYRHVLSKIKLEDEAIHDNGQV